MTDPRFCICEILGDYAPLFNIYSSFFYEKAFFDPAELSACGKNDRFVFDDPKTGFLNYIISKERTEKRRMLNNTVAELFSFLNLMLKDKNYLLCSFEKNLINSAKNLEKEAYDVYLKSFNGDI